ncbi:MAG: hypothetical protein RR889_01910, partial [Akkermansia sp.]
MKRLLIPIILLLSMALPAMSQLMVSMEPTKKQFVNGEPMTMRLTISNNTGKSIKLSGTDTIPWLDIHVERNEGSEALPQTRFANFPNVQIPPGKSVSRRIDLRYFYDFSRDGYYKAIAVVRPPNMRNVYASTRALFSVVSGMPIWSETIATRNNMRCKYSVCGLLEQKKQRMFVQVKDGTSGASINTVGVGEWLSFIKPLCRVDSQTNLHVLFLTTPNIYCQAIVNPKGERVSLNYFKR